MIELKRKYNSKIILRLYYFYFDKKEFSERLNLIKNKWEAYLNDIEIWQRPFHNWAGRIIQKKKCI